MLKKILIILGGVNLIFFSAHEANSSQVKSNVTDTVQKENQLEKSINSFDPTLIGKHNLAGTEKNSALEKQISFNTPVFMEGVDFENQSMGFLNLVPHFGWDYPSLGSFNESQQIVLEKANNGVYIRALNPRTSDFNYFNISNRGYVYLDRKSNAREFRIIDTYPRGTFRLVDIQTGSAVGKYSSGGIDYLTIYLGTEPINFRFFGNGEIVIEDKFIDFSSSFFSPIFNPTANQPTMSNGTLSLPHNSMVQSKSINFEKDKIYRITLGNLKGNILFEIVDIENSLPFFTRQSLLGQGQDITFFYTHSQPFNWEHQSIIRISGNVDTTFNSFKIEQLN